MSNEERIENAVQKILADYTDYKAINKTDIYNQPDKEAIIDVVNKLIKIIYPGYYDDRTYKLYSLKNNMSAVIEDAIFNLKKQVIIVLKYRDGLKTMTEQELDEKSLNVALSLMEKIPEIRATLDTDIQATYDGDPAAGSKDEIIFSYPGLLAISVYRIAHELWLLNVPMIPRIMTEYAHSKTGIDIHPGATIGKYFCIDHGTGIVIGETTVIGEHVKMYQGVTLGGLSTKGGQDLKGTKRHPTIKDNVTIYSGASILGGKTVIGENVVIGGNTFITESVESGTTVFANQQDIHKRK